MQIIATTYFIKSTKAIAKRYKSFNADYQKLLKSLEDNPRQGNDLGDGLFKIRIAISSKGKGKSGGARIITFDAIEKNECLYLLYAYDKSDYDTVKISVIKEYIKELNI